jgi:hypothetical protein
VDTVTASVAKLFPPEISMPVPMAAVIKIVFIVLMIVWF